VAIVAVAAGFGGPAGAWLIMGIGLCAVMLGTAVLTAWQQRRSVARP
jgi:thiazole synthase ThiGH ThiG subunit